MADIPMGERERVGGIFGSSMDAASVVSGVAGYADVEFFSSSPGLSPAASSSDDCYITHYRFGLHFWDYFYVLYFLGSGLGGCF